MPKYEDIDAEPPRHRKKIIRKSPPKAKHKHSYTEVIAKVVIQGRISFLPLGVCSICGKMRWGKMFFVRPREKDEPFIEMLTQLEDIQRYYPDLEIREVPEALLYENGYI